MATCAVSSACARHLGLTGSTHAAPQKLQESQYRRSVSQTCRITMVRQGTSNKGSFITPAVRQSSLDDDGFTPSLRDFGIKFIETKEPLTAVQLEQLSGQFPGAKLERRGKMVTIAPVDPISNVTSAEVIRQLGNWIVADETHVGGAGGTAFRLPMYDRDKVTDKELSEREMLGRSLKRADSLLVPDAWVMSQVYYTTVKKRGIPELGGCKDAFLLETIPEATDLSPSGSMGKAVFDKADNWMRAGAGYLLIVDPYSEECYGYDRRTWMEGKRETAMRLDSIDLLTPRPDLFPGLEINFTMLLERIRIAKTETE